MHATVDGGAHHDDIAETHCQADYLMSCVLSTRTFTTNQTPIVPGSSKGGWRLSLGEAPAAMNLGHR
ncbi:MAG: hypothetical protein MI757_08720 [Pirellulales bacterium]|nr:hypothetical protein [Pirellulales bacterium]